MKEKEAPLLFAAAEVSSAVVQVLTQAITEPITIIIPTKKAKELQLLTALTTAQVEVMIMICDGVPQKAIAEKRNCSLKTIQYHIKNLYKRTDCQCIADLVRFAIRNGVIEP